MQPNQNQLIIRPLKLKWVSGLALLLMLFGGASFAASNCNLGCLSCDSAKNACQFCDFQSFYFLDSLSKMCIRRQVSNCALSVSPGKCLICAKGHYPDSQNKCRRLSPELEIDNCELYFGNQKCAKCEKKYYISKTAQTCKASELQNTRNCSVFGKSVCLRCENGFVFDPIEGVCSGESWLILKFLGFRYSDRRVI